MPRLSKAHERTRRRLVELGHSGYTPQRLSALIMHTLQESVGWDGYRLFGLDEQSMLVNRLLAASENDTDARLEFLREVYLSLPTKYAELPELTRTGLSVVAFQDRQEECFGFPKEQLALVHPHDHYRYYHEFRSPVGGALLGIFRDNRRPVAAFQVYRRSATDRFRATDVTFLRQMCGLAGQALASSLMREHALAGQVTDGGEPSGIVMVDRAGGLRFATPAGNQWLDVLGHQESGLPSAIWAAMADLRTNPDRLSSTITVPTRENLIRIEATASGEPDVTAIVIARHLPPALPEVPASWHLTPQERGIVQQLASGKGNREIGDALYISEHTVEWHLRKIYDKLGVRNRQEVITALFRQTFLPGIERLERSDSVA